MTSVRHALCLITVAALAACSSASARTAPSGHPTEIDETSAAAPPAESAEPAPSDEVDAGPTEASDGQPSATEDVEASSGSNPSPSASDASFDPDADKYAVEATVSPTCVKRGETVTLVVTSVANAGVAYHAVYANEEGGAPPPYGKGHGGNDGGQTNIDGHWEDTWTVGPSAPSGEARVDVVVGKTDGFGRTSVPFAVANVLTGRCD